MEGVWGGEVEGGSVGKGLCFRECEGRENVVEEVCGGSVGEGVWGWECEGGSLWDGV